jgi:hypothetical protein
MKLEPVLDLATVLISGAAAVVAAIALFRGKKRSDQAHRLAEEAAERERTRDHVAAVERRASQGWPTTSPNVEELGPGRAYRFRVANMGKSWVTDLVAELVDDSAVVCSEDLPHHFLEPLEPSASTEFVLTVTDPIDRDPLYLQYRWRDGQGQTHSHISMVKVPPAQAAGPSA